MKLRLIAAAVLLPLLLVVLLALPGVCTMVLVGLMAAVSAIELLWNTGLVKQVRLVAYSAVMAFLLAVWSYTGMAYAWLLLGILVFSAALFGEVLASHGKLPFAQIAICFVGGFMIPLLLTAMVRLRAMEQGKAYVLIPFAIAFMSDSGAYFAGKFLGKHKLAPNISPNKTVEGMIGGVAAGMVGMVIFCLVLQLGFGFRVNYGYGLICGLAGSLAGVFGDLAFSAIKRQTGVKDYGKLIPGHGGVLDRFDSMVMIAPLVEAFMILIPIAVK